jgi:PTH1 family peptidyl-tRNA hydrolase
VKLLLQEYRLETRQLLLVLDDLNLPFGRIRIRSRGSAGGHNGLESVLRTLGSAEVSRVRVGIGEEDLPADKAKFVLADFPPERDREVDELILRAVGAVKAILRDGLSQAMAVFNA